jgi:hypothetical protein
MFDFLMQTDEKSLSPFEYECNCVAHNIVSNPLFDLRFFSPDMRIRNKYGTRESERACDMWSFSSHFYLFSYGINNADFLATKRQSKIII